MTDLDLLDRILQHNFSDNRLMAAHLLGHIVHYRDGLITNLEMSAHITDTLYGLRAASEYNPLSLDDMRPLSEGPAIGNNGETAPKDDESDR